MQHAARRRWSKRILRRALKWIAGVCGGLLALLLVWGVAIEPRVILDVRHEVASVPRLPAAWEGAEIAVAGDFQFGMWLANERMIRRVVREIVARRPAVVLLPGDFIYHPLEDDAEEAGEDWEPDDFRDVREQAARIAGLLRPLTNAGIPTFAVLGNHDYAMEERDAAQLPRAAEVITTELRRAGIEVLRNESIPLPPPGSPGGDRKAVRGGANDDLFIVGVGPHWPRRDDPRAALADVPDGAARVVLMHNPRTFSQIRAGAAPFAVAGHTHGGQVRVPGLPNWSWLTFVLEDEVHADGWIPDYGAPGNRLYVNRGIGFSEFPIRINCPPELTIFRLTDAR